MYSSLEARVPLLDHNIIEFALNLDENFKIFKGTQKYILKELTYEYIPKKIMERPKWGFSIPLEKWLQNDLKYLINNYLNKTAIEQTNCFNYSYVNKLINSFFKGEKYLYNRIWILIIIQKFLIKHYEP